MLPWWFWVLLWIVLILATLLLAVVAGFRLFKRGMSVVETLGEAAEQIGEGLAQEGTVVQYTENPRRYPHGTDATHADPEQIRQLRDLGKEERIEVRRVRRVTRRAGRGQAQNMRDLRLF